MYLNKYVIDLHYLGQYKYFPCIKFLMVNLYYLGQYNYFLIVLIFCVIMIIVPQSFNALGWFQDAITFCFIHKLWLFIILCILLCLITVLKIYRPTYKK